MSMANVEHQDFYIVCGPFGILQAIREYAKRATCGQCKFPPLDTHANANIHHNCINCTSLASEKFAKCQPKENENKKCEKVQRRQLRPVWVEIARLPNNGVSTPELTHSLTRTLSLTFTGHRCCGCVKAARFRVCFIPDK